jgi:drug/metabolite transporter (DMT)-like permease
MSDLAFKILLGVSVLMGSLGQMLLKRGMKNMTIMLSLRTLLSTLFRVYTNIFVLLGSLVYAIGTFLWLAVLSKIELSYAYPMVSMNFVIVALLSKIFFKEHVSKTRWVSIIMIVFGVGLLSMS